MAFDYPINLDLEGASCILAGGGPLAVDRLTGLWRSRADVVVISPSPSDAMVAQCAAFSVPLVTRPITAEDLDGARLAIVTREDPCDVAGLHEAAKDRGVLFAALDDAAHCDFGPVSTVRRGSLAITVSSGGRAPALATRLRQRFDTELEHELTALVEVIAQANQTHGPRDVPPSEWSRRWEKALVDLDGLLGMLADGREHAVQRHILDALAGEG